MKKQICLLIFLAAFTTCSFAQSFTKHCLNEINPAPDCGIVANPKVLTIFWNTTTEAWNSDAAAALPTSITTGRTQELSVARINAYVQALFRSSYFSELSQYEISPPEWMGSIISQADCENPNTVGTLGGVFSTPTADFIAMQNLVHCVKEQQAERFENVNMVLLFVPPQVTPNIELGFVPTGAFHLLFEGLPTIVVPIRSFNLALNGGPIQNIIGSIGRELAEGMTDADPLLQRGFVDDIAADAQTFGTSPLAPEIGTVCGGAIPFIDDVNGGRTFSYWSQDDGFCVSGFDDLTTPFINSVVIRGSGRNMQITISGAGFGSMPQDLQSTSHVNDSSLYFELLCQRNNGTPNGLSFGIGHSFNPRSSGIGLRGINWTDNQIQINGFGGAFGSPNAVLPGDVLNIRVANENNGRVTHFNARLPLPDQIIYDPGHFPIVPSTNITISGILVDENLNRLGNVPFRLSPSNGTLGSTNLVTDDQGNFQVPFTTPSTAGPVVMTARFPNLQLPPDFSITFIVTVVPVIETIQPIYSNVNGSTLVTITGKGFSNGNTKIHLNYDADGIIANVNSNTEITFQAPVTNFPGVVPLTVSVGGIHSTPENEFTYFRAFSPIFTVSKGPDCGSATFTALLLNPLGAPAPNLLVILTALEGKLISEDGNPVGDMLARTDAQGIVKIKMTSSGSSNTLTIQGHTSMQPENVTASTTVISKNMCDKMSNFHKLNLKIRFVLGDQLIPEVTDGCFACEFPSRFQVKWHSNSPVLKKLSVNGFTEDAMLANNCSISVLGIDKASPILKKNPITNEVVGLLQLNGDPGKSSFFLNYDAPNKYENYSLLQLTKGKWIETKSIKTTSSALKAELTGSGIYAIVVHP